MRFELLGLCFTSDEAGLPFSHNSWLVALSFLTAAFASFVALDMIERFRQAAGRTRLAWHAGAAVALGGGIWSMHFIGMLAFNGPAGLYYDPAMTILSLVIAVIFVAGGLDTVRRGKRLAVRIVSAGLLVGVGVSAMHYTGMAAMRIPGSIAYDPLLFALSGTIAAAASVALLLAFSLRKTSQRAVAAVVMACAICGMHYTGMAATIITLDPLTPPETGTSFTALAIAVAAGTYGLLILALIATVADRRLTATAVREAERLKAANVALEQEIRERCRVEEELRVARNDLELGVVERTRDLEEARSHAEMANRAKSDFLASMSHELRTPLNAILGFAQLLDFNSVREPLTPMQRRATEQIARSGRHLLVLIDEVLDLARVESGHLTLSMEAVNAGGVIDEVAAVLQPLALDAGIALVAHGSTAMLPVTADRTRLSQVITNLVSNAIKYNRRNGTVEVTAERGRDGMVTISVRDTGPGIPAERIADLFVPFNRLGQEHGVIQGTGIGLTITKRLVEAMHGTISVESAMDVGSVFRVSLLLSPVEVQPLLVVHEDMIARSGLGTRRLLYIEDNPSNIELMRDLADAVTSMELQVAADPAIGLDIARASRPDIIILDINLPGMDGFEVLRRLRADPRTASIPVLALTANAMPREVEKGLNAGFYRYLTKPLQVPEFLTALDEALDRQNAA